MRHVMLGTLVTGGALTFVGCALEQAGDETALGKAEEGILQGTLVNSDTWGSPNWGCSSTLLREQWLLTAKHCGLAPGATATLENGAQAQVASVVNHPNLDVTLARLTEPLIPDGIATTNGPYPLYMGSPAKLLNQTLYCQGWGLDTCPIICTPTGGCVQTNCAGGGLLRSANLKVDQVNTPTPTYCPDNGGAECYRLTKNASNQYMLPGDSGGGCMLTNGNVQKNKVTGVQSTYDGTSKNWQISAPYFRDWANGIIGGPIGQGSLRAFERSDLVSSVVYSNPSSKLVELALTSSGWVRTDLTTLLGGATPGSPPAAVARWDGYSSLYFRGTDNHIWEFALLQGGGWSKGDVTQSAGGVNIVGTPSAYQRSDRVVAIVARASDGGVHEFSLTPGATRWVDTNLTGLTGAPTATNDPFGYVVADGSNAVVYRSSDGHVRELWRPFPGNSWVHTDLTAFANAPLAMSAPRPYTRADGVDAVIYRGNNNEIHELAWVNNNAWVFTNLSTLTNAPAVHSVDPVGYVRSDGNAVVVFKGTDRHIYQLRLSREFGWLKSDLTTLSNAPLATTSATKNQLGAFVRADRINSVLYRTDDDHIHEISLPKGSNTWSHADITAAAGGSL